MSSQQRKPVASLPAAEARPGEPALSMTTPFCPVCGAVQRSSGWLRWHLRKVHAKEEENSPGRAAAGTGLGDPQASPQEVEQLRLECPRCRTRSREFIDATKPPRFIKCDGCNRLIPFDAWRKISAPIERPQGGYLVRRQRDPVNPSLGRGRDASRSAPNRD